MKIALIVRTYSKRGGISGYAAELAERFAANDEVHIFANYWQDVGNKNIVFHKIPMLSFGFLKKWKKYAWNNVFEIWSFMFFSFFIIRPENFDIIHSQGDYIGKLNVFTVHSCHKAWLELAKSGKISLLERLKKSIFNPLHFNILLAERYSLKKAKKMLAISQGVKREIIQYYKVPLDKIEIVPNGVDIKRFNPENKLKYRSEIRNKYGLKDTDFVIIFPAHEFKRKGLYQIIEALNILKNESIYILVVGRDAKAPFIEAVSKYGLQKSVIFAGESAEIEKYYAASDLFVFPTRYEPFGLVITEAMATGIPVIVSKDAGAAELIEGAGKEFLLGDHKSAAEIAEKIKMLLENVQLRNKLGIEMRKTAENYSWDIIAAKTMSMYKKSINE